MVQSNQSRSNNLQASINNDTNREKIRLRKVFSVSVKDKKTSLVKTSNTMKGSKISIPIQPNKLIPEGAKSRNRISAYDFFKNSTYIHQDSKGFNFQSQQTFNDVLHSSSHLKNTNNYISLPSLGNNKE